MLLDSNTIKPNALTWILATTALMILIVQSASPINSNDIWWHMAIGRHILETGQFIFDHSILTWTPATPYHVYNAWLAEIILYLIYDNTGSIGLISLGYLVHGGFFALAIYFAIQRKVITNPLTWVIITLGIVLSFMAAMVQPELFSFAFMVLIVWLYFSIRTAGIRAWFLCYVFPIIIVLWTNSHGAFVMSSFFFIAVGIGELLNIIFSPNKALPTVLRYHLLFAFFLCIPALLINPFGYALPLDILNGTLINTTELSELSNIIGGYGSTAKYNGAPYYALDYLVASMVIYVFLLWQNLKSKQTDWAIILVFVIYSLIFIQMIRTTYFLAPIFVFSSLDLLAHKQNSWAWPQTKPTKTIIAICCILLIAIVSWRIAYSAICLQYSGPFLSRTVIDRKAPLEEADFIQTMGTVKKLGNTYEDGGYLLYKLWPSTLTMVDSRYFPFKAWIKRFFAFQQGYDVQNFLNQHQADAWLINYRHAALVHWFHLSKDWSPLFVGSTGIVFGHATNQPGEPKISANIEHTDSAPVLLYSFQKAIASKNWAVAERINKQVTFIAANRPICSQYVTLANNVHNAFVGTYAFYHQDYATAAANLRHNVKGYFIDSTNMAIWAITFLAKGAWDANDYANARAHAIDALSLSPKNISSVYNATITDWQYRKSANPMPVSDDITWQFLVDILLKHKEKIPPTQTFIIDIFIAMRNGTLHEKPPFITTPVSVRQ